MNTSNDKFYKRYQRHLSLPNFNAEDQVKLNNARVLCVGMGGLGCPAAQYLAGAGIGKLGLMDHDTVDLTNLHRQILYTEGDVGQLKALVARKRLMQLNSAITIHSYPERCRADNIMSLLDSYDIILDCSDNFSTRYLLNDACVAKDKILISGSVYQYHGQCLVIPGNKGPCYRCLFPNEALVGDCNQGGVLGVVPGMVGLLQATEVVKIITGVGENLIGKFLSVNLINYEIKVIEMKQDKDCPSCAEQTPFEALHDTDSEHVITPEALKKCLEEKQAVFLLDVRTVEEYAEYNIGGVNIPIQILHEHLDEIDTELPIIALCASGMRSAKACEMLIEVGKTNVKNLQGGLKAFV